ncbi:MAG: glutamate--tRNA ligase [Deltaproteobacteria bacterium]|nr:glutamate--tRNA ligase [Deltaproteobacteria bacterium]
MTDKKPRFRFAPSPTGHLHIGGARTALYNWLMAKKTGGTFVLRIEDTDRTRSTEEYIESIMQAMKWLNLDWQEGPFHQTDRFDIYKKHVDQLIAENKAYRCYCTAEELDAKRQLAQKEGRKPKYDGSCRAFTSSDWEKETRPYCIRFKAPQEGSTLVQDLIRGEIEFQNTELDDLIIWRTDQTPTYNFCVVVDDVTMEITHVIRGDDHLNNTPRQILLYQALNYPTPYFAHVPMILGSDKTRLSKRHGATSVTSFRDMGYLPDALLNYLARLGWAYEDKEIMSRDEMIQYFTLEAVGRSPGVFNPEKLDWLNGHYIRQSTPEALAPEVERILQLKGMKCDRPEILIGAIRISIEKAKTLSEMVDLFDFIFKDEIQIDEAAQKILSSEETKTNLRHLMTELEKLDAFTSEQIHEVYKKLTEELKIKLKDLAQPTRAALCGKTISPGIYESIALLGKEKTLARLKKVSETVLS